MQLFTDTSSVRGFSAFALLCLCAIGAACQGTSSERSELEEVGRVYQPIDLDTFIASQADRHQTLVERREHVTTVERVAMVEADGAGIHLLQPLRDVERSEGRAADGVKAGGLHYFPANNRYPAPDGRAQERVNWSSSWEKWPVSIEPLMDPGLFAVSLWDKGGRRGYCLEVTFGEEAREWMVDMLGETSGSLPQTDWCRFPIEQGKQVTDMQAALVGGGFYDHPFSIRDLVQDGQFPITVVLADSLPRDEADRLMRGLKR